jgi:tetratricopeptide (TPR) repeat protein
VSLIEQFTTWTVHWNELNSSRTSQWTGKLQQRHILNGRASAYAGLGEFDRAAQEFAQSIELCPRNAWVYFNQAEAYEKRDDTKHAVANYKLSMEINEPRLSLLKRKYAETKLRALQE